jgi:aminoglycoside 3-N-acetyltransferase
LLERLVRPAKDLLRGPYRRLEKKYLHHFRGFTASDLIELARSLGITAGDAVFVHSGMDGFAGFEGGVADIVRALQQAVTANGALLMPTIPFTGSALEYAKSGKIFDPRRTPSQVGLVTEVFRRFPDVERTLIPTHPVAVWGADTNWWTTEGGDLDTPCGRGTPFERLYQRDGKILLAGVSIRCLTYFHYAEEVLESRMPFSPFTSDRFSLKRSVNGNLTHTPPLRLYNPEISRRRNLLPLAAELQKAGGWRQGRVGTLELVVLNARDVLATLVKMADDGVFCYRNDPPQP